MRRDRTLLVVGLALGLPFALASRAAASEVKIYKSEKGTCQVALPPDWTADEFGARDPNGTLSVTLFHELDAKVEKLDEEMVKAIYGATKIFENTDSRLFVESQTQAFGPMPAKRKWESLVPAAPKGACQVIVVFKSDGAEGVARAIVASLKPAS